MFYTRQRGLAIHGTDQPYLLNDPLPRDYSHGCARMYNSQALWLYAAARSGRPCRTCASRARRHLTTAFPSEPRQEPADVRR